MNKKIRAAEIFAKWRNDGVPTLITMHEAFRLSGGKFGTDGDHSTPVQLSLVASKMGA